MSRDADAGIFDLSRNESDGLAHVRQLIGLPVKMVSVARAFEIRVSW
jgi:hypothetical protein